MAEAKVRRDTAAEALRRELGCEPEEAMGAPCPELPEGEDPARRLATVEQELAALGPVNPLALEELGALEERHRFLEEQVEDVRRARRELHQVIRAVDDEIMRVFAQAFADVNEHFQVLVGTLFPGGTGRLTLTDATDLLDTGVEVEARPAGKNVRKLSLLSGGERSLVALAFLFAVFRSRPSPFYLARRGRGRPRRREPASLLGPPPRIPGRGAAHHREPPEEDHGGRRRPRMA